MTSPSRAVSAIAIFFRSRATIFSIFLVPNVMAETSERGCNDVTGLESGFTSAVSVYSLKIPAMAFGIVGAGECAEGGLVIIGERMAVFLLRSVHDDGV